MTNTNVVCDEAEERLKALSPKTEWLRNYWHQHE
jgi:hypothetical protein